MRSAMNEKNAWNCPHCIPRICSCNWRHEDMTSITESEQLALQLTDLSTDTPFAICGISTSIFSLARCGGMTFQGQGYTYIPQHDECIRNDVLKWLTKYRKQQAALVAIERENEALQLDRCPNTGDRFGE